MGTGTFVVVFKVNAPKKGRFSRETTTKVPVPIVVVLGGKVGKPGWFGLVGNALG